MRGREAQKLRLFDPAVHRLDGAFALLVARSRRTRAEPLRSRRPIVHVLRLFATAVPSPTQNRLPRLRRNWGAQPARSRGVFAKVRRLHGAWIATVEIPMRRNREFLATAPFASNDYASIVQTDYPGAHDWQYRDRVTTLVAHAEQAWPNCPRFEYTAQEHETWAFVSKFLVELQQRYSCSAYLDGIEALELPADEVPQLDDVSARMEAATGFMLAPVGGLLHKAEFLPMLRDKVMRCTPYLRHPSYPFFTPEPDIVHELRGHAPMFMHGPFVEMSVGIGEAALAAVEAGNDELVDLIGLFYWYTVEYGMIRENGTAKVFGAGNNAGIQDMLRSIDPTIPHEPLTIDAIAKLSIDYDAPQEVFFVAESFEQIAEMAHDLMRMAGTYRQTA